MSALFALYVALQIADGITTFYSLRRWNREANPVMVWLFGVVGVRAGIVVAKIIATGLGAFLLLAPPWVLAGVCAFYVFVVGMNLRALRWI